MYNQRPPQNRPPQRPASQPGTRPPQAGQARPPQNRPQAGQVRPQTPGSRPPLPPTQAQRTQKRKVKRNY
ncbi:MAG: hypothetical protein FWD35_05775, partial [Oscillospiraceae bacterium]|nr:hypothetical protein [Oscillospiraceae bacterium]